MSTPPPSKRQSLWTCLLLAILVLLVFSPMLRFQFISFDDPDFVTNNPHIQQGLSWAGVKWAFTSLFNYWQPLVWLSYMLDYQLFGLSSAGFHFTGLLIHLANTLLLFLALKKLTRTHWPSAIVAALFAFHPLHVETVAWVADRKSLLCSTFWMLTLLSYAWYAERPSLKRLGVPLLCFALGLMCKSMLVTLPCVLLLLDFWPLNRLPFPGLLQNNKTPAKAVPWDKYVLLEKIPFFLLSGASSLLTIIAQRETGTFLSLQQLPFLHRLTNAVAAYAIYLRKTFWPVDLSVFYPHPGLRPLWQILGAALVLLAVTIYSLRRLKKQPYLAVGWFWFLGTLVPVIGFAQVGELLAMADRYTYLSLIGIFIMLVWGVSDLVNRPATSNFTAIKRTAAFAALVVIGACIVGTIVQLGYWRNSRLLFEHAEKVSGPNFLAQSALGDLLSQEGHQAEAEKLFQSSLALRPHHVDTVFALGNCYLRMKKPAEAAACFDEVTHIKPDFMDAHFNLAVASAALGQFDRAIAEFNKALELEPNEARAHLELGLLLAQNQNLDGALLHFQEAVRLAPTNTPALKNLAWTLVIHPEATKRNGNEAVRIATRLCELSRHKDPIALNTLAAACAEIGNYPAAIANQEEAIALAKAAGQQAMLEDFTNLLKLYQNHRPCRDLYAH